MFPTLVDLGIHDLPLLGPTHLFLPTYGVLFAASVLVAWWWFSRRARSLGLTDDHLFNLCFYTLLGGILGAKLLLILVDWRYYLSHPAAVLATLRSAGVLLGGVTGGALAFFYYGRKHALPLGRLADAIAAPLALSQAIGRLGCVAAGCCWGVAARPGNPFAVVFTDPVAGQQTRVPLNVPLVPTQWIQAIHDGALALVLTWLWRRKPEPPGTVIWIYALLYSLGRGIIEFWRGDADRGLYFGELLSTSQLFALAGAAFAIVMLLRGRRAARAA